MHPLLNDFSNLTDSQIEDKIISLTQKYWKTANPQVQHQISLAIDTYKLEQQTRRSSEKVKQQNQDSDDNSLDKLIKVS